MTTDQRKEKRTVGERIDYLIKQLIVVSGYHDESNEADYREILTEQIREMLAEQREMSVEAVTSAGATSYVPRHIENAILSAKLEDRRTTR